MVFTRRGLGWLNILRRNLQLLCWLLRLWVIQVTVLKRRGTVEKKNKILLFFCGSFHYLFIYIFKSLLWLWQCKTLIWLIAVSSLKTLLLQLSVVTCLWVFFSFDFWLEYLKSSSVEWRPKDWLGLWGIFHFCALRRTWVLSQYVFGDYSSILWNAVLPLCNIWLDVSIEHGALHLRVFLAWLNVVKRFFFT